MKKRNKKKLIISSYDDIKNPVYAGGGARAIHELALQLKNFYNVTVITGTYPGATNKTIQNVKYIRIGSDVFGNKIGQLVFQISLLSYIYRLPYDVWLESATPPFTFSLLPLLSKKPVICWVTMLCSDDMQRKYKINFSLVEKLLSQLYSFIIVPTPWIEKLTRKLNAHALIKVIEPGIEIKRLPEHARPRIKPAYILFLGRIEINQKGLDLLLAAVKKSKKDILLYIAGTGAESEETNLTELINTYNLQNSVRVFGRVEGERKQELLQEATALVLPSRFETFGLAALEALSQKKPIVCFDLPQLSWIPNTISWKVKPFSVQQLSILLDNVYSGTLRKHITHKQIEEILFIYSRERSAHKFHSFIQEVNP